MKKRLSVLIFLLLADCCLFAQGFHFDVTPVIGMRYGKVGEYVYANNSVTKQKYTLSYLEWEMKPLWYYGGNINIGFGNFYITGNLKGVIPSDAGFLLDSDWGQDNYYRTGDTTTKTNFSKHSNVLNEGFLTDVIMKYEIKPSKIFSFWPLAGISYDYTSFTGKDGFASYGYGANGRPSSGQTNPSYYAWDEPGLHSAGNMHGDVISYLRSDFHFWLGLGFCLATPNNVFAFEFNVMGALYSVYTDIDGHLARNLYFFDQSQGTLTALKIQAVLTMKPAKRFALQAGVTGMFTKDVEGTLSTSASEKGPYKKTTTKSGADAVWVDANFGCKIFIF